jgi:putative PIN family toxin of toxin-antitoxin system
MRVCIDTNVLVQLFGRSRAFGQIADALQQGKLELAVSNEILLEYEESLTRLSGEARWQMVWRFLDGVSRLHNNVLYVEPHFRFQVIAADPDDNKFVDCAVAVEADFILTWDRHFDVLNSGGYKPKPIGPGLFIGNHL